jgi:hypothetical protein
MFHHVVRPVLASLYTEDYLSYFRSSISRRTAVLQYAIPYCTRLPLVPVALVRGAAVGYVLSFWVLSSLWFLLGLVSRFGRSADPSLWPLGSSCQWLRLQRLSPASLLLVPRILDCEHTLLGMVFRKGQRHCCASGFAMLESKVAFLQALNQVDWFPIEVLKIHEPG